MSKTQVLSIHNHFQQIRALQKLAWLGPKTDLHAYPLLQKMVIFTIFFWFFLNRSYLWSLNQLWVLEKSLTNNLQQVWALRKLTKPNLRPLYIAFHSEKLTFLLHLSRIFLSVGYSKGSNLLHVQERSMANDFQQIWTLWMLIRPDSRPLV